MSRGNPRLFLLELELLIILFLPFRTEPDNFVQAFSILHLAFCQNQPFDMNPLLFPWQVSWPASFFSS